MQDATLERVVVIVRELALEVGGDRAARATAPLASLERDLGLGSLERVELLTRLEAAFGSPLAGRRAPARHAHRARPRGGGSGRPFAGGGAPPRPRPRRRRPCGAGGGHDPRGPLPPCLRRARAAERVHARGRRGHHDPHLRTGLARRRGGGGRPSRPRGRPGRHRRPHAPHRSGLPRGLPGHPRSREPCPCPSIPPCASTASRNTRSANPAS